MGGNTKFFVSVGTLGVPGNARLRGVLINVSIGSESYAFYRI